MSPPPGEFVTLLLLLLDILGHPLDGLWAVLVDPVYDCTCLCMLGLFLQPHKVLEDQSS